MVPGSVWVRVAVAAVLSAFVVGLVARKKGFRLRGVDDESEAFRRVMPLAWVAGAFALYLAVHLFGGGIAAMLGAGGDDPLSSAAAQVVGVYGTAVIACAAVIVWLGAKVPGPRFGARAADAVFGLVVFAAAAPALLLAADVAVVVRTLIVGTPPDAIAHSTLELIVGAPGDWRVWILIAGAVVGAPVFEEMVFRGLLQTGIMRAVRSRWAAIVVTATIFAFSHRMGTAPVPWHALGPIFMVGIVCGYAAEKRGVLAAMVTHASFNASQVGFALVFVA